VKTRLQEMRVPLPVPLPAPDRTARRAGISVARALGSPTRAGIYEHLRQAGVALTVRDVAAVFELHPNVARTHLELLADAGLAVVGRRKHPGGGRPAKVYLARDETEAAGVDAGLGAGTSAAALVVRVLVGLVGDAPTDQPAACRVHEAATAEGRRLVAALPARGEPAADGRRLESAAQTVVRALRSHAPEARVLRAGSDWVEVAGIRPLVALVDRVDPPLAGVLERGLLGGAFAGAGVRVTLTEAGSVPAGGRAWRAEAAAAATGRGPVTPAETVDTRGQPRETGVVRAMRAVTGLRTGDVLEVLAEGPGSPAAFARWADRAGHVLLGVERATDLAGRPAIRLLIRKGGL
jgi:predicted ArsR family transcriptional regulator/TusA-related sulfurtransferase